MTDPMPAVRSILGMPPEPVDHKTEAEEIITHRGSLGDPHGLALVHATLYLAEQQRLANEMALMAVLSDAGLEESDSMRETLSARITKGLGL